MLILMRRWTEVSSDDWSAVISAFSSAVSVVAFIVLIVQLKLLREQVQHAKNTFIAEQERIRRQATLEFMTSTLNQRLDFQRALPYEENEVSMRRFLSKRKRVTEERAPFWDYLNYFEVLATSVNCEIFDIEVVQRVMGPKLVRTYDGYHDLIASARIYYGRPSLYKEMEILATNLRSLKPDDQRDPNNHSPLH
jgi:hypothetical protein